MMLGMACCKTAYTDNCCSFTAASTSAGIIQFLDTAISVVSDFVPFSLVFC